MDNEIASNNPSQNDRIMAALAHVTVIVPMIGLVAPIVIWATQKDKSAYIAFQALQAAVYQLFLILAYFVGMGCYMCSFFGMIPVMAAVENNASSAQSVFPWVAFFPLVVFGGIMAAGLLFFLYGLIAAVLVLIGKDFRYVLLGRWLERYLQKKTV